MAMHELRREVEACPAIVGAEAAGFRPVVGIVLSSVRGGLTRRYKNPVSVPYVDLPWFPVSTLPGHSGELLMGELAGVPVVLFSGRSHYYENGDPRAMALPLALLSAMGAKLLIPSNAAGSTGLEMTPGTLMLITHLGAGLGHGELHHGEVKEEGAKATDRFGALIIETVRLIGAA